MCLFSKFILVKHKHQTQSQQGTGHYTDYWPGSSGKVVTMNHHSHTHKQNKPSSHKAHFLCRPSVASRVKDITDKTQGPPFYSDSGFALDLSTNSEMMSRKRPHDLSGMVIAVRKLFLT